MRVGWRSTKASRRLLRLLVVVVAAVGSLGAAHSDDWSKVLQQNKFEERKLSLSKHWHGQSLCRRQLPVDSQCSLSTEITKCYGIGIPYAHHGSLLDVANASFAERLSSERRLDAYAAFRHLPGCWWWLRKLLCQVYFAACNMPKGLKATDGDNGTYVTTLERARADAHSLIVLKKPQRALCSQAMAQCPFLLEHALWPAELSQCNDSAMYTQQRCKALLPPPLEWATSPLTEKCLPPLVRSRLDESAWVVPGCAENCTSAWFSFESHVRMGVWSCVFSVIALIVSSGASLYVGVSGRWYTDRSVTFAFTMMLCYWLVALCWALPSLSETARNKVMCREDGSLNVDNSQSGWCAVQGLTLLLARLGAVGSYVALVATHVPLAAGLRRHAFRAAIAVMVAVILCCVVVLMIPHSLASDGFRLVCLVGATRSVDALGFYHAPVVLILLLACLCLLTSGRCPLAPHKLSTVLRRLTGEEEAAVDPSPDCEPLAAPQSRLLFTMSSACYLFVVLLGCAIAELVIWCLEADFVDNRSARLLNCVLRYFNESLTANQGQSRLTGEFVDADSCVLPREDEWPVFQRLFVGHFAQFLPCFVLCFLIARLEEVGPAFKQKICVCLGRTARCRCPHEEAVTGRSIAEETAVAETSFINNADAITSSDTEGEGPRRSRRSVLYDNINRRHPSEQRQRTTDRLRHLSDTSMSLPPFDNDLSDRPPQFADPDEHPYLSREQQARVDWRRGYDSALQDMRLHYLQCPTERVAAFTDELRRQRDAILERTYDQHSRLIDHTENNSASNKFWFNAGVVDAWNGRQLVFEAAYLLPPTSHAPSAAGDAAAIAAPSPASSSGAGQQLASGGGASSQLHSSSRRSTTLELADKSTAPLLNGSCARAAAARSVDTDSDEFGDDSDFDPEEEQLLMDRARAA